MAQNNTNDLYFDSIELNKSGTIEIQAKEVYSTIDRSKKSVLLEVALRDQTGEMIFVSAGYNREIWKKDLKTGQILFVGSWDLNNPDIYKFLPKMLQTTKLHPWFFYVGGQVNISENSNLFLSTQVGSFLLKDRWNVALSGSMTSGASDVTDTFSATLGLLTKVYFPIRKYNISPYVGAGISRVISRTSMDFGGQSQDFNNNYWDKSVLIGVSWFTGPGSLDFGLQVGTNFNITIGYTFSL